MPDPQGPCPCEPQSLAVPLRHGPRDAARPYVRRRPACSSTPTLLRLLSDMHSSHSAVRRAGSRYARLNSHLPYSPPPPPPPPRATGRRVLPPPPMLPPRPQPLRAASPASEPSGCTPGVSGPPAGRLRCGSEGRRGGWVARRRVCRHSRALAGAPRRKAAAQQEGEEGGRAPRARPGAAPSRPRARACRARARCRHAGWSMAAQQHTKARRPSPPPQPRNTRFSGGAMRPLGRQWFCSSSANVSAIHMPLQHLGAAAGAAARSARGRAGGRRGQPRARGPRKSMPASCGAAPQQGRRLT